VFRVLCLRLRSRRGFSCFLIRELIADLLPVRTGKKGRPFRDARQMVEGIIYRYRCGIAWRDVPAAFGPCLPTIT
jgi:transposase